MDKLKRSKVIICYGTRPEIIKLFPLIRKCQESDDIELVLICTGQHGEMIENLHRVFKILPNYNLKIIERKLSLNEMLAVMISEISTILDKELPDLMLVQGDTTTAFAAAISAFYKSIPVSHVEAGLRTSNSKSPFPEEINRQLIARMCDLHFAATESNRLNLIAEGIESQRIHTTGNTGIDAVIAIASQGYNISNHILNDLIQSRKPYVLVTTHRRESWGDPIARIVEAIVKASLKHREITFLYPLHPNPILWATVEPAVAKIKNVNLIQPLDYVDLISAMKHSSLIMTDSGGIQEEAASFGKHVLVLRESTERTEGIEKGIASIVGSDPNRIYTELDRLLNDNTSANHVTGKMFENPYGDGLASNRILACLIDFLRTTKN